MSAILANASIAIALLLTGVATLLALVGILAFARLKHGRMAWVALAFALLAAQGVIYALDAYATRADPAFPTMPLVSLGIAISLYLAVLKR